MRAIARMSAGLAALLYALQPSGGDPAHASTVAWILGVAATLAVSVMFALVGYRSARSRRAAFRRAARGWLPLSAAGAAAIAACTVALT
jgi:hypothetical protein